MFYQRRGNKFNNTPKNYGGQTYQSKKEASYAQELDLRKKAGEIKDWDRQVKISLDVNGFHICNYYIDFVVVHNDDTVEYVEVKGFATEVWRMKWKLCEALYGNDPNIKLTVIW